MRLIAVALVAAFSFQAAAQDKLTIEWKLKKGDKIRYEMSQETNTAVGGMEIEQNMLFGMAMEVEDVNDKGVAKFKVTYDRIKISMSGMMDTDYDSDKADGEPEGFAKMFAGMVGKSFKLKLNTRGEVVGVEGYVELMEEATKELDDPMVQGMQGQFDDEMVKKMMQMVFPVLPDKAVAKGDNWEHKSEFAMPGLGGMKTKSKKTLKEVGDKEVTISDETTMETKEGDDNGNQMVQITEAKSKGDIVWDTEKGQMKSTKGTTTMTMSAGGQEFTMEMKQSMKLAPREEKKKDVPSVDKDKKKEDK